MAGGSNSRWTTIVDSLRAQLWPWPVVGLITALVLGVGLPRLDLRVGATVPTPLADYLFSGGADAAHTVLSAVASSLITVMSLTFSLTVVTLQLASSQYSPRLLRTFGRDRFVQGTLALFVATFVYALTVLRTIRSDSGPEEAIVPRLSVTLAYLLTMASVPALVLFLAHLAREIRVETVLWRVHDEARETAERLLPARSDPRPPPAPRPPTDALTLTAPSAGSFTSVDEAALVDAARRADCVIMLDPQPGTFLVDGTPIGVAWCDADAAQRIVTAVADAVRTGVERTAVQDVAFGLRQITDVATRALSPGINDPTTAVRALGYGAAVVAACARRRCETLVLCDDDGSVRVVLARPDLHRLLSLAVDEPARYGATEPPVQERLLTLLAEVAWTLRVGDADHLEHPDPADLAAVRAVLERLRRGIEAQPFDVADRLRLEALAAEVEASLADGSARQQP